MIDTMIVLPPVLKKFNKEAKEVLEAGFARDIEFSGGTYQVLVVDPRSHREEWAFIQLDAHGRLKDSFCSCKESEQGRGCLHQAASYLHIYGDHAVPLHLRFERSLWNRLCRCCSLEVAGKADPLKATKEGAYVCRGGGSKELFSIKPRSASALKKLEKILFQRREETEETSLKFSNLSDAELALWHQGQPTEQLIYELSVWSDLAKWLHELQEAGKKYTLDIEMTSKEMPKGISVHFSEVEAHWVLQEQWMAEVIPGLATVDSPLPVKTESTAGIEKIVYDKEHKQFAVVAKKGKKEFKAILKNPKGVDFGQWRYVPGKGFYSKEVCFLTTPIDLNDVEKILNEHSSIIKQLISGTVIREVPVSVSYALAFDDAWNLHVQSYLFNPGDLSAKGSQAFGEWVYVDGRGFYRWEGRHFDEIETVIPEAEVVDFISQHRLWLNTQEGFHTHLNPLSADLTYQVTDDNALTFGRNLAYHESIGVTKDFGRVVYIAGHGFYLKDTGTHVQSPVRAGATIPKDQVSYFIHNHKDELQAVKSFFAEKSPVERALLNFSVSGADAIDVIPEYVLLPEYEKAHVCFFDDYSYVEGEGFFPLSGLARLPERYREKVTIEGVELTSFMQQELERLMPIAGTVDPRLRKPKRSVIVADAIIPEEQEGQPHYKLKLEYESELGRITLSSLWWALQKNQRYLFSDEGVIDLADKRYSWLRHLSKKKIDRRKNLLTLTPLELLRLNALEEITVLPGNDALHRSSRELLREFNEFKVPEQPNLKGLVSVLRPYQQHGLDWLWFLYHHGLSGLLCDDMGLGKTHQAMALMAAVANKWKKEKGGKRRHYLVVCPTSVIYHWQEKLTAFLPGLKVWTFHGTNRSLKSFDDDYDILLTSYGIWRNETEALGAIPFEVAIFDELQIAKNQTSRIYSALLKARARMRLGMTGTPIENRLRELKSLFDIVLPTYMPSEQDYKEHFIIPIERNGDFDRKRVLARLVKPFVMRRKKEDVLVELPAKIEEISHCDLMPEQRKLYVDVLAASRDKLLSDLQNSSNPIPYMHIFTLLSHLKQICNHPASYLKKASDYKHYQSGKWDLFLELLEEARESGQKVVVFSHYLTMLDIIEDYLKEHGIGFAAIRGTTVSRGEQLHRFNNDPECEVFVGSLQAAGLGIDLTAGSVVIHYDRWWNAARENQATDRVHRIGQTRGVQVFKLMTKGTLEEHIDFLISKKGRLMEDVVSVDDHQTIKKLDRTEIIEILQMMPRQSEQ